MGRTSAAAIAVGCGIAAGFLYLGVTFGSPGGLILVYLTQLPLFAAGLWFGAGAAATAALAACLVMLAASDLLAAALFAALNAAPVVLLVRQALLARQSADGKVVWYPSGLLAAWLTGIALAGIAAALVAFGGPGGLQDELRAVVAGALDRITDRPLPGRDEIAASIASVVPGVIAVSWMVMSVINAALAQGLLQRFKLNWRPSPDLATLNLPRWLTILLGLAAAATMIGGGARFVGLNAMIVLSVPFCLAGLGVLHMAVRRLPHPLGPLIAFYSAAALFGWPLLVVAILGLCEPWLGLRRRLIPPGGMIDG